MSTSSERSASLTHRIVEAATAITIEDDWAGLTMGRLASAVGVSRQTIYNEVGSKPQLAELIVLTEASKFLDAVNRAFDAHQPDYQTALHAGAKQVLELGQSNVLLRSIVGAVQGVPVQDGHAAHGVQSALLPLLTTQSQGLLAMSASVVSSRLQACGIIRERADLVAECVVRLVLSYLIQPSHIPERTAEIIMSMVSPALNAPNA